MDKDTIIFQKKGRTFPIDINGGVKYGKGIEVPNYKQNEESLVIRMLNIYKSKEVGSEYTCQQTWRITTYLRRKWKQVVDF